MELLQTVLEWVQGDFFYVVFFGTLIFCGLGVPLQADLFMIFCGSLAAKTGNDAFTMIPLGISGLMIGDSLVYLIGRTFGFKAIKNYPFRLLVKAKHVYRAHRFFQEKGPRLLLIVRFVPGTRTATILSAGIFRIRPRDYFLMNGLGVVFIVPLHLFVGYFLVRSLEEASAMIPYLLGGALLLFTMIFTFHYLRQKRINGE